MAPVATRVGVYEVIKQLPSGGLAELLLAKMREADGSVRHVVIKRLRAELASKRELVKVFLSEARLAATLKHPNIVEIVEVGEEAGRPYIVMAYVHGEDLRTLLTRIAQRREQVPLDHVVTIVSQVAAALHHAHEKAILHRDVAPANILLTYDGTLKIVDFGIAKATLRQGGALKGKAPYMSPEQCTGQPLDRRADVFALGVVLYELATVRRLFKEATEFATMSAIVRGDVPRPSLARPEVTAALEAIIVKALARQPRSRFQSAAELHTSLEGLGLRASTSTLATYMAQVFGERPEPWLVEAPGLETTITADFDGEDTTGLAPAPDEATDLEIATTVKTSKTSPLVQAQQQARSSRGLPPPFANRKAPVPASAPARGTLPSTPPGATLAANTPPALTAAKPAPVAAAVPSAPPAAQTPPTDAAPAPRPLKRTLSPAVTIKPVPAPVPPLIARAGSVPITQAVSPEASSFAVALHEDMPEEPPTIIQPVSAEDLALAREGEASLPSVIVAGGPARGVATQIVKPLDVEADGAPKPRRTWRWVGLAAAAFAVSAAIAFGGASRNDDLGAVARPKPTEPVAAPVQEPEPPRPERTWANTENAPSEPAVVDPAPAAARAPVAPEPVVASAPPPTAPPEPVNVAPPEPPPVKRATTPTKRAPSRPAPTRTAASSTTRRPAVPKVAPTKPAAEPTKTGWNPNALFPKHK